MVIFQQHTMPHDCKGRQVNVGDEVIFRARVKRVDANKTACNIDVVFLDVANIGEYTPTVCCNTRLAEVVSEIKDK